MRLSPVTLTILRSPPHSALSRAARLDLKDPLSFHTHTLGLSAIDLLVIVNEGPRVANLEDCLASRVCLTVEGKSKGEIKMSSNRVFQVVRR
jgi:hypothetical protein